ncbi:MAG: cytochrome c [Pirellulaceae bacterium]|nr:MAG: cytochrome c [Pirellulaceae bacterium]
MRKRVYTGFRKYNVQAVINNLQWGLDHRIYGAGSSNGGMIQNLENPEEPAVRMGTHDFRFDPKTGRFELLSGGGRFGLAFDDWGNRFICNIRNPIRHAVFPDEAARRNQRVPFPPGIVDVAEAGDTIPVYRSSAPEPWRIENARRLAEDRTAASPRSESVAAGYMTSACGLTIYRGSAYPPEYYGQAFLGEVAGNLIHRQRLVPDGVTFRSRRIDTLGEFVTSDDNWFRPVNFVNAPDGTLHVLDMYRETIEHPWSIPEDLKQKLDLESGRDRGRIYRLAPPGFVYRQPIWPGRLDTEQLVALFEHPNGWHRDTAFRLIYERQDRRAIEPLRALLHRPAQKQKDERDAVACVLALWSLEGLGALQESDLLAAYEHPDPHVREHAVQLAGRHMSSPAIWELLHRAIEDKAIRVAYQAVLAAGGLPEQERWLVVCRAIEQPHTDRWWHYAILSTAHGQEMSLFRKLVRENLVREHIHASNCVEGQDFVWMLAECVAAAGSSDEIAAVVRQLISGAETGGLREPSWHLLAALDSGARRRGRRLVDLVSDAEVKQQLTRVARQAVAIAGSAQQPLAVRVAALHLASQLAWPEVQPLFARLVSAAEPSQLEGTALRLALGSAEPNAVQCVIDQYRRLSPAARSEALSLLVARPASASRLLDALEDGRVPVADLSPGQAGVLVRSRDPSVQERARRVLQAPPSDRQEVVRQYRHQVAALGDARAGREVFAQSCSSCHRLHGLGSDVGPPLETVLHRSIDELLVAILDPSREVAPNYQEYLAVLRDGRTVTGIMAEESPSAITLRRAGQQQETLARSDIEELFSTGKSLMPEGLERNISPQQMADLLAFLKRPEWHTAEESSAGHR